MRAKIAQEGLVTGRPLPYSIVRSTQFFEFVPGSPTPARTTAACTPPRPTSSRSPPATSPTHLAAVVTGPPINDTVEIAGPQPLGMDELVRRLFAITGDPRPVQTDPEAGYFGAKLTDDAITPTPGASTWIAPTTYDTWLREEPRGSGSPTPLRPSGTAPQSKKALTPRTPLPRRGAGSQRFLPAGRRPCHTSRPCAV